MQVYCFFPFFIHDRTRAYAGKKRGKNVPEISLVNYGKEPPKEYSLERFARLGSYLERHKEENQLDDITWNDLGMDEVFCRIDRTLSAAGEGIPVVLPLRNISCGRKRWSI